jgi:hypothetical protein
MHRRGTRRLLQQCLRGAACQPQAAQGQQAWAVQDCGSTSTQQQQHHSSTSHIDQASAAGRGPSSQPRPSAPLPLRAASASSTPQFQRRWWSAEAAAPSKRDAAAAKKKAAKQAEQADAPSSSGGSVSPIGMMPYRRPRFQQYYDHIVARELVLKTDVGNYAQLPRIERLDLSFTAPDNFRQVYVEKWQMLFYALGLEYLTGEEALPGASTRPRPSPPPLACASCGMHHAPPPPPPLPK